jgi:SAM-dependent methyltransferase
VSHNDATPAVEANSEGARFELRLRECPICVTSTTRTLGYRGGVHQRYGLGVKTPIVQCNRCALIFPNPFPYALNPSELYGDPDKYHSGWDEDAKVEWYRELVRDVVRRTGKASPRLLDVGCGRGEFLRAAQTEGLKDILGLELSEATTNHARGRGVPVERATLEEFAQRAHDPFDAIVLNAVLEHVYDPDSMIDAARRITQPGAILYVEVPCEPHLLTHIGNGLNRLRQNQGVLNLAPTWPPYHVFGFNPRALRMLLAKHAFKIESIRRWADPVMPAGPDSRDRLRALVATQINRLANVLGMSSNMFGWARRI